MNYKGRSVFDLTGEIHIKNVADINILNNIGYFQCDLSINLISNPSLF